MDLEEEKEGKTENGSFRNTTHSGKCHDAFHGVKTGLRNTVSIIVRELSIEWNKKEGEEEKKKSFFASCRLSKRALEREYFVDKLRKQKVTKISLSILNTIEKSKKKKKYIIQISAIKKFSLFISSKFF